MGTARFRLMDKAIESEYTVQITLGGTVKDMVGTVQIRLMHRVEKMASEYCANETDGQ